MNITSMRREGLPTANGRKGSGERGDVAATESRGRTLVDGDGDDAEDSWDPDVERFNLRAGGGWYRGRGWYEVMVGDVDEDLEFGREEGLG